MALIVRESIAIESAKSTGVISFILFVITVLSLYLPMQSQIFIKAICSCYNNAIINILIRGRIALGGGTNQSFICATLRSAVRLVSFCT